MSNVFDLDVDIKQKNYINEPVVTQNDDVVFNLRLTDNGAGIDLSDYESFSLTSVRPDKKTVLVVGDEIGNSQVEFDLGTLELEKTGTVNASIQLYAGGRVSSIPFTYKVLKDLSDDYVPTENDKTIIEIVLGEGPGVIEDAKKATEDAITATDNANTATAHATAIGDYASEQGDYAKIQGNHAKNEGDYAKEQGEFAHEEGTRARDEADRLEGVDVSELESRVGDLSSLDTETKENLVSAINENVTNIDENYDDLADTDKTVKQNKSEFDNYVSQFKNKHIYDSGSNSNGYWIKFEGGTMICWGSIDLGSRVYKGGGNYDNPYRTDDKNAYFASRFVGEPTVFLSSVEIGSGTSRSRLITPVMYEVRENRIIAINVVSLTSDGTDSTILASFLALGAWE